MHSPIAAPDRVALRLLSLTYFVQAAGALSVVGSLEQRAERAADPVFGVTRHCYR